MIRRTESSVKALDKAFLEVSIIEDIVSFSVTWLYEVSTIKNKAKKRMGLNYYMFMLN
jgi:hypothetical protein